MQTYEDSNHPLVRAHSFIAAFVICFVFWLLSRFSAHPLSSFLIGSLLALTFYILSHFGIPPPESGPLYRFLIKAHFAVGEVGTLWHPDANVARIIGIASTLLLLGFAAVQLWLSAKAAFKEMPELHSFHNIVHGLPTDGVLIVHLTDLHITESDEIQTKEGRAGGQHNFARLLRQIRSVAPQFIVISGDMTDTGSEIEWRKFHEIIAAEIDLQKTNVLISPGNHDLSPAYGKPTNQKFRRYIAATSALSPELDTAIGKRICELEAEAKCATSSNIRSEAVRMLIDFETGPKVFPRHPFLIESRLAIEQRIRQREPSQQSLEQVGEILIGDWFHQQRQSLFPLRSVSDENRTAFFILNSNKFDAVLLGNSALGACGQAQLLRLEAALASLSPAIHRVVIIIHHAPFRRWADWNFAGNDSCAKQRTLRANVQGVISRMQNFSFLPHDAKEARQLFEIMATFVDRRNVEMIVFCGHRHMATVGRAGKIVIIEGGSMEGDIAFGWAVSPALQPSIGRI